MEIPLTLIAQTQENGSMRFVRPIIGSESMSDRAGIVYNFDGTQHGALHY